MPSWGHYDRRDDMVKPRGSGARMQMIMAGLATFAPFADLDAFNQRLDRLLDSEGCAGEERDRVRVELANLVDHIAHMARASARGRRD